MAQEKFYTRATLVDVVAPIPGYPRGVPGPSTRDILESLQSGYDACAPYSRFQRWLDQKYLDKEKVWEAARDALTARYGSQTCGSHLTREFPSLQAALDAACTLSVSVDGALWNATKREFKGMTLTSLHSALLASHEAFGGDYVGGPYADTMREDGGFVFVTPRVRVEITPIGRKTRLSLGMASPWIPGNPGQLGPFAPFVATSSLRAAGLLLGWRLVA